MGAAAGGGSGRRRAAPFRGGARGFSGTVPHGSAHAARLHGHRQRGGEAAARIVTSSCRGCTRRTAPTARPGACPLRVRRTIGSPLAFCSTRAGLLERGVALDEAARLPCPRSECVFGQQRRLAAGHDAERGDRDVLVFVALRRSRASRARLPARGRRASPSNSGTAAAAQQRPVPWLPAPVRRSRGSAGPTPARGCSPGVRVRDRPGRAGCRSRRGSCPRPRWRPARSRACPSRTWRSVARRVQRLARRLLRGSRRSRPRRRSAPGSPTRPVGVLADQRCEQPARFAVVRCDLGAEIGVADHDRGLRFGACRARGAARASRAAPGRRRRLESSSTSTRTPCRFARVVGRLAAHAPRRSGRFFGGRRAFAAERPREACERRFPGALGAFPLGPGVEIRRARRDVDRDVPTPAKIEAALSSSRRERDRQRSAPLNVPVGHRGPVYRRRLRGSPPDSPDPAGERQRGAQPHLRAHARIRAIGARAPRIGVAAERERRRGRVRPPAGARRRAA